LTGGVALPVGLTRTSHRVVRENASPCPAQVPIA
jgi:hypothetical protein